MHRRSPLFLLAAAALAAAQPSAGATSGCGTQIDTIISACLASTQPQLDACKPNDWDCMCTQQTNVLTCYNNCPSDPNKFGASQQQVSWCNAAKAYGSSASTSQTKTATTTATTTATATATASGISNTAEPTETSTVTSTRPSASTSASSSAPSTTPTGESSASNMVVPAGLAAVLGLAALL